MMKNSVVLIAFGLAAAPALAHHGFGSFNMDAEIEITGTVTDLAFVNPHSWLYLDVAAADGGMSAIRCEMRSATTLRRSGWTPEMFPVGSRITITGSPDRNDPTACYVSTVVFADGSSIDRYGQRTPPVAVEVAPRATRLANGDPNIAGLWAAEQIVMTDPRGVLGSLVPLSEVLADGAAATSPAAPTTPAAPAGPGAGAPAAAPAAGGSRRGGVPLISGAAASRLFTGRVPLTEAGEAAAAAAAGQTNPAMRCEPIGILMDWSYDSPVNRIAQDERTITLEYGKFDYARTVHLDQAAHPVNLAPSVTGHSIGRWENDVLIVDTVGFRAGSLTRGLVHSEALHVIERFRLDPATLALTREFIAEDSLFFSAPYTDSDMVLPSNVPYESDACDDRSLF